MFKKYTLLQKVFSIFADLGNVNADLNPLHSNKHNKNDCIF